jgi:hypothetical protein
MLGCEFNSFASTSGGAAEKVSQAAKEQDEGKVCKKRQKKKNVSEIITAENISLIESVLNALEDGAVVLFDCDNVLITANIEVFVRRQSDSSKYDNDFSRIIHRERPNASWAESLALSQTVLGSSTVALVNSKMPELVANLQTKGIPCLVVTAFPPSPAPGLPNPTEWRASVLARCGYDFARSWPGLSHFALETKTGQSQPVYHRGILFCGAVPKGAAVAAFFAHVKTTPRHIVFIDDDRFNVESIRDFCEENEIRYTGIHYTEGTKYVSPVKRSSARSEFQMKVLLEHDIWLPDEILPADKLRLDWVELCERAMTQQNVACVTELLNKIDKKLHGRRVLALAKRTGAADIIKCVEQWLGSGRR